MIWFVTWCIILLEVHQKMVHCSHKGMNMSKQYSGRLWRLNDARLVLKTQSVPRKYPPHHYTSTSLNHWDKADDPCFHVLYMFWPDIWMSQQKSRLIRPGDVFNLLLSSFVSLCELYPPCAVLIWPERHPVWSSAAGAICFRVRCVVCSEMVFCRSWL